MTTNQREQLSSGLFDINNMYFSFIINLRPKNHNDYNVHSYYRRHYLDK